MKIITAVVLIVGLGWLSVSRKARGIRNNNPGNIRWDNKTQWQGMVGADRDGFLIFDSPENGVRAMARVLANYSRRGVDSLSGIVSTWAPPTENDTQGYIESVSQRTGIQPGDSVGKGQWPDLIAEIIHHENGGNPYGKEVIERGIAAA